MNGSKTFIVLLNVFNLLILFSCQKNEHNNNSYKRNKLSPPVMSESENNEGQADILTDEGFYQAKIISFHDPSRETPQGVFNAYLYQDDLSFEVRMNFLNPGKKYLQFILSGDSCDRDNLLDHLSYLKLIEMIGQILIPLDHDVSQQLGGFRYGPISNNQGFYIYKKSTSYFNLMDDLYASDPDVQDDMIKIPTNSQLHLSKRVIVILEHDDYDQWGRPVPLNQSRPVACGEIELLREGSLN